jgi:hypothetical protein
MLRRPLRDLARSLSIISHLLHLVVMENSNGYLTQLSAEGLPLLCSWLASLYCVGARLILTMIQAFPG